MEQETTKIADLPFCVTFRWKEDAFKISLIDGEDLFKIADLICDILEQNGISHKIEKTSI